MNNALASLISVDKVNTSMVKNVLDLLGFDTTSFEKSVEVIEAILSGIRESQKYQTLGDVLADEELVKSLKEVVSLNKRDDETTSAEEALYLHKDTCLQCKRCGHLMTLRQMKGV